MLVWTFSLVDLCHHHPASTLCIVIIITPGVCLFVHLSFLPCNRWCYRFEEHIQSALRSFLLAFQQLFGTIPYPVFTVIIKLSVDNKCARCTANIITWSLFLQLETSPVPPHLAQSTSAAIIHLHWNFIMLCAILVNDKHSTFSAVGSLTSGSSNKWRASCRWQLVQSTGDHKLGFNFYGEVILEICRLHVSFWAIDIYAAAFIW